MKPSPEQAQQREMHAGEREDKFHRGIELFNARRFFDAHEAWEEIWLQSPQPERAFLQGIIQIAAAFHHYLRGNRGGARSLLNAGLLRLAKFPATHGGIALDALRAAAQHWTQALGEGNDPGPDGLPQIHCATGKTSE